MNATGSAELASRRSFGQQRNVLVLLATIFVIACGEELWSRYVPNYLEALGASVLAVSAYGTFKDFLDAIYPFPGGVLTARLNPKRSLLLFNSLAVVGYAAFAIAKHWWILMLALPFIMGWQSLSLPATFSIVGDALARGERSMAFAWQSIVRRIPVIVGPIIGGVAISALGLINGMHLLLYIGIALGIAAVLFQLRFYRFEDAKILRLSECINDIASLHPKLKRLLAADILVRFGQGIGEIFIVLYATQIVAVTPAIFGLLIGLAMTTSILVYTPVARLADLHGREPWVTATYGFFALFPLFLGLSTTPTMLVVAFILMGLREIGEPPRKALIVDWARTQRRSVDIGTYYFVRGLAVFPASLVGGALWRISPHITFFAAAAVAAIGMLTFHLLLARSRT